MTSAIERSINLLIVEDEAEIRADIAIEFEQDYSEIIKVHLACDVGEAIDIIKSIEIDAVILDIVMPYGSAINELQGNFDDKGIDAGLKLLQYIRADATGKKPQIWVAVATARSDPNVIEKIQQLIGGFGTILLKPFSIDALVYYLCDFFKIEFRGMIELLPNEIIDKINRG